MSDHHERAAGHQRPRLMNYREVAESVGAIALDHACSGNDTNAALWAYAHARAAAHFARLHLTNTSD